MSHVKITGLDEVKLNISKAFLTFLIFKGPDLPITYPCQSADISQVVFIEFHGSKTEVYCEVEPNNGNKWLVKINLLPR